LLVGLGRALVRLLGVRNANWTLTRLAQGKASWLGYYFGWAKLQIAQLSRCSCL